MEAEKDLEDAVSEARAVVTTKFCGAEVAVVGLSPCYWSHISMHIADIHHLQLVNGIPCLQRCNTQNNQQQCYPVSKCCLVGTIAYEASSHKFVLDDGTGLVDVIFWGGPLHADQGIYALPPLATSTTDHHPSTQSLWSVGDRVRVLGRIECMSVSEHCHRVNMMETVPVELRKGMFEIHASIMEPLVQPNDNNNTNNNELNWEANHWIKSIQATQPATNTDNPIGLRNANDTVTWLGPKIANDVCHRRKFPSADDTLGAWRVFGVHCHCDVPYKDALLYCHCQATPEPLDPNFQYRDALLQVLLQMEQEHHHRQQQENMDLRFIYRTVANHAPLNQVAMQVVSQQGSVQQLVVATFRALRKDGILYLLDEKTDTYLLLSTQSVLEPYVTRAKSRRWRRVPIYLQQVPSARIQYVKRCLDKTNG
ncbi:expressed unknown protein [Seminavis robusta]|uniref:CST complex subunit Stn1 N-terminal domain-containing protein n=1 Tax=Seminavis robusta TaxID=568900 RepID=A0A9N8ENH8_9STRA|nr:expressed unknown protein [Seminavis robusta]|eukprot:Sro1230_g254520.1 n/a (424) ;mRNA; f:9450-10721